MMRNLSLFLVFVITVSVTVAPASAQRRGGLLRRIFNRNQPVEDSEPEKSADEKQQDERQGKKKNASDRKKPTPAQDEETEEVFGMVVNAKDEQLLISELVSGSDSSRTDLKKGDVLKSIAGMKIESRDTLLELSKLLREDDRVEVEFLRDGEPETTYLTVTSAADAPSDSELPTVAKRQTPTKSELQPLEFADTEQLDEVTQEGDSRPKMVSILEISSEDEADDASIAASEDASSPQDLQELVSELRSIIQFQNDEIERLQAEVQSLKTAR